MGCGKSIFACELGVMRDKVDVRFNEVWECVVQLAAGSPNSHLTRSN